MYTQWDATKPQKGWNPAIRDNTDWTHRVEEWPPEAGEGWSIRTVTLGWQETFGFCTVGTQLTIRYYISQNSCKILNVIPTKK